MKESRFLFLFLGVILGVVLMLSILLLTGAINENKTVDGNETNNNEETVVDTDNNTTNYVNLEVTMNNAIVSVDAPNSHISVSGTMSLSYDQTKYEGIEISGYCLGENNEKYLMKGPCSGQLLLHNGDNNFQFCEIIPQDVSYADGNTKAWSDIDWANVRIKSCRIDKLNIMTTNYESTLEQVFNYEKNFD